MSWVLISCLIRTLLFITLISDVKPSYFRISWTACNNAFLFSEGEKLALKWLNNTEKSIWSTELFKVWQFKYTWTLVTDEDGSGCGFKIFTPALETHIDTIVLKKRQLTIEIIPEELYYEMLQSTTLPGKSFKYCKISARWIIRELTNHLKKLYFKCVQNWTNTMCRMVMAFW